MSGFQVVHKACMAIYPIQNGKLGLLVAASVVSYVYSGLVLRLLDSVGWSLVASPQIAVAVIAVCLLPKARARWSPASAADDGKKELTASSCQEAALSKPISLGGSSSGGSSSAGSSHLQSFRLAQPPFTTDLSYGVSRSYSCTSASSRRRRLPRISIELTPLPRVSLEFQRSRKTRKHSSSSRSGRSSSDTSSACCSSSTLQDSNSCSSLCWQPSMSRISSEQNVQLLAFQRTGDCDELSAVDSCETVASDIGSSGGVLLCAGEATESLGRSVLNAELEHVSEVVSDTHLLQVGALLGEPSSRAALVAREAGGPLNHPDSFYGSADTDASLQPWELIVSESNCSVLYWAWRRPLRKGLFMYMTRSVFLNTTPAELRAFMNDDVYRVVWDNSTQILRPVVSATSSGSSGGSAGGGNAAVEAMAAAVAARTSGCGSPSGTRSEALQLPFDEALPASPFSGHCSSSESCSAEILPHENGILQALVQFPKPMASRSYIYARRVWHRPSDGGCYCLSKACEYQSPPALPGRAVAVEDFVSGCVVKSPAQQILPTGYTGAAAEVTLVYFEDSHVRPGLANMGVKKGLWPLVQRTEKALRVYQAGAAANVHLQPLAAPNTQRLQRSRSVPSPSSLSHLHSSISLGPVISSCSYGGVAPAEAEAGSAAAPTQQGDSLYEAPQVVSNNCSSNAASAAQVSAATDTGSTKQQAGRSAGPTAAVKRISSTSKDSKQLGSHTNSGTSKSASGGKQGPSWQAWLSDVTTAVGNALKGSAQVLAAASAAIWRSHTRIALMVPSLEWKLLQWCVQRVTAPKQLLLLPAPAASSAGSRRSSSEALQRLNSHPIGDWAHPGLLRRLLQDSNSSSAPSLLRVASHPLSLEDLDDSAAGDEVVPEAQSPAVSCNSYMLLELEEEEMLLDTDEPAATYGGMQGGRRSRFAPPVAAPAAVDDGFGSASLCGSVDVSASSSSSCCSSRVSSSYPTSTAPSSCASGDRYSGHCSSVNSSTAGSSGSSRLGSSVRGSTRVRGWEASAACGGAANASSGCTCRS